jgi:hypothetical protein
MTTEPDPLDTLIRQSEAQSQLAENAIPDALMLALLEQSARQAEALLNLHSGKE